MIIVDFERFVREMVYSGGNSRFSSGSFALASDLVESSEALSAYHKGVFAFLAYNPLVEDFINTYVESGAAATDSDTAVMVLLLAGPDRGRPAPFQKEKLISAVRVVESFDPVKEALGWFFPGEPQPIPPGIAFFDRPLDVRESVYVPIREMDSAAKLAVFLRGLFAAANAVQKEAREVNEQWFDSFCARLVKSGTAYTRVSPKSRAELWAQMTVLLRKHGLSIATAVAKKAVHL